MFLTFNKDYFKITNKLYRRILSHAVYLGIVMTLIPVFFYFELFIVLPVIAEPWTIPYFIHMICGHFILLNIIGNLIFGMFTNSSICGKLLNYSGQSGWSFCSACECYRPPRAWHCSICDVCVLKRDHHCSFFANCVGYYNHRYFIFFAFYIFVGMAYALIYNVKFLMTILYWNNGFLLLKLLFPIAFLVHDMSYETFAIFLVVINVILCFLGGFFFIFHFINVLRGRIVYERNLKKADCVYDQGWRLNLTEVFGIHWYLAWILPFIESPLPGNGIEWPNGDKTQ